MFQRTSRLVRRTFPTGMMNNGIVAKSLSSGNLTVKHDSKNNKFYIPLDSDVAFVQYDKANNVITYYETSVPPEFQGKGIAQILAKAAFDYVVKNDMKMKVTCTYLQSYLERNAVPEYTSRIVQ